MPLNKVCNLEDWDDATLTATMRRVLPGFVAAFPQFPGAMEHRKHWEFAQLLDGLAELGALQPDGMVLAVAAGQEAVLFDLTNHVRWVFATDIYGTGNFAEKEADAVILLDPDAVAPFPYNRRRLVVQYMDALDLRYEDGTFDAVYSLSSIEHFGGTDGVRRALSEQRRVVRVGGIVALTTEVVINGADPLEEGHLLLSTPEQLVDVCESIPGLALVEPIDFSVSDRTCSTVLSLSDAVTNSYNQVPDYPHIILEHQGRHFTSVSVFLRRVA
ncbi:MAG TPA: methyltransferase domain-containing protein [Acidimicrobiales bacterium]|nr:methyltransferase domain-containing protein [Acidimicrobiales bacterium]